MPKRRTGGGISTAALAQELGISIDTLYRLKSQGIFQPGRRRHYWTANPIAARPTYRWNLAQCLKTWEELESNG